MSSAQQAPVQDPMLERTLGGYRIVRKIAQGGMGAVYEAVNTSLGRRAAVKVLLRELLSNAEVADRFFNEAIAISKVSHPCLVTIYEHGTSPEPEGRAYIVMEYLDGESLRARCEKQYLGGSALELMKQLASALSATHRKRIIHRDLKPDNIMLVSDETVPGGLRAKILDFGIAKLLPEASGENNIEDERRSVRTRTGALIGTPAYMSPEQCRAAGPPDEKTDVYSLGTIFFEVLYGEPPFLSESAGELYALHMFAPPPDLRQRIKGLDQRIGALIFRMLAKKPAERPSMEELLNELQSIPSSGMTDGTPEQRPSNHSDRRGHRESSDALAAIGSTSAMIRHQMSVNTTGASTGERVTPVVTKQSTKLLAAMGGAALVLLLGGFLTLVLTRQHALTAPSVSTTAPVVPHTPTTNPPPAAVTPPPTPPPVVAPAETDVPTAPGKSVEATPRKEKTPKKAPRGSKNPKYQIDLWK